MKKEFVPYEIALKLKELGFEEQCFADFLRGEFGMIGINNRTFGEPLLDIVKAPLWQQAFDWFRSKYKIDCWLESVNYAAPNDNKIGYKIIIIGQRPISFYYTYEEARIACLEKLIEIIKNKTT